MDYFSCHGEGAGGRVLAYLVWRHLDNRKSSLCGLYSHFPLKSEGIVVCRSATISDVYSVASRYDPNARN